MVWDSDLQSLSVVNMFFGDIFMMYPILLFRPLPFHTPKLAEVLKIKYVIKKLKILFGWRNLAQLDFLSLDRGDLGG
jgi:hypothetical protein